MRACSSIAGIALGIIMPIIITTHIRNISATVDALHCMGADIAAPDADMIAPDTGIEPKPIMDISPRDIAALRKYR